VHAVIDAAHAFFDHLAAIKWSPLGIGVGFYLLRVSARPVAWRNIIAAAYPDARVPLRRVFGAYWVGVGINAVVPARGGDAVKLVLVKQKVPESTYPTLAATLIVETLFDFFVSALFFIWALSLGVLPGVHANIPGLDWNWVFNHPKASAAIAGVTTFVAGVVVVALQPKLRDFRARVRQGFAILRPFERYLRGVVTWQALSWVFRFVSTFYLLRAFGLPGTAHNVLLTLVVQSLATLLPFTPGGFGTEQGLLVAVFHGKLPATALLSFSVGQKIVTMVVSLGAVAAALFAMVRTLDWRRLRSQAEAVDQPPSP
jgi:uncharacterized membrane protein YbhN (UPF0104 family)